MRLLSVTLHYFDFARLSTFAGRSTNPENADTRREVILACQRELEEAIGAAFTDVEMVTAGMPSSGLIPVTADLSELAANPRHFGFACMDLAYRMSADFDWILVVEDDIAVSAATLRSLKALLEALPSGQAVIPNRLERFRGVDVCVDMFALPGWHGEPVHFGEQLLQRPNNTHSAFLLLDRARFRAAYEARAEREPAIILGDYIASGFANVNGALDVLRARPTDSSLTISHRDAWLPSWQAAFNVSDTETVDLITAFNAAERDLSGETPLPLLPHVEPGRDTESRSARPTISVVIPAYNARATIRRAMESVADDADEVIVVDDGSTDETHEEVESTLAEAVLLRTPNRGLGNARNLGLSRCTSDIVVFLDADDWLEHGALGYIAERMADPSTDLLSHSAQVYGPDDALLVDEQHYRKLDATDLSGQQLVVRESEDKWLSASVPTYAYRRQFLVEQRLAFPSTLHEDEYFAIAALLRAQRVESTSRALYARTIRPGSIMQSPRTYRNAEGWAFAARLLRREAARAGDRITPDFRKVILARAERLDENARTTYAEVGFGIRAGWSRVRIGLRRSPEAPA